MGVEIFTEMLIILLMCTNRLLSDTQTFTEMCR